jgi:ubiquinone/menaquinone biosynthesis C-methylase UbiE
MLSLPTGDVIDHFTARAARYDRSSAWCSDSELLERLFEASGAGPEDTVLDLACGTGLVSRHLAGRVGRLVGVDITPAMAEQARDVLDTFVLASAEALPFDTSTFDVVVCRQGLQFMEIPHALAEVLRVLRPRGRFVTVDLHAYGAEDRDEYFEILRLRNPARRNFFVAGDMAEHLARAGFGEISVSAYVSAEDIERWADHGAIDAARVSAIQRVYERGSPAFLGLHAAEVGPDRIVDHMRFEITTGRRPS